MNQDTGVQYPTIELAGVTYTLKASKGALLFRISDMGLRLSDRSSPDRSVAATVKLLHALMEPRWNLSHEELTDTILAEDKLKEVCAAVNIALGKIYPPTVQAPVAAGDSKPAVQ